MNKGPARRARRSAGSNRAGIQRIRLDGVLPPPVSHYCDAVRAGNVLYLSGLVGMDRNGRVFEHVTNVLAHVGADVSRVTSVLIHLTNMEDRARINPVRIRYFGEHRPASTLVEVASLIHPDLLVEVTCTAYLGR